MKGKNILILIGLFIAGAVTLGYQKVTDLQDTFYKLTTAPYFFKNVRVGISEIKFDLDVIFKNPTPNDFYVTGSVFATLNKLHIMYQGKLIGIATLNLTELSIPANGQTVISNIPVTIPTSSVLANVMNLPDVMANFTIVAFVDILGTEYQIGA
jgi:hypothetical protein